MELWDIYNRERQAVGRTHRRGQPLGLDDYHLVVFVWLVTTDGRLVITRRHPDKPWPLLWECTGGSVLAGEDSLTGAIREVFEETGFCLQPDGGKLLFNYVADDTIFDVWLFRHDVDLASAILQEGEVVDIGLATLDTIAGLLDSGQMVPTLRLAFEQVRMVLQQ